MLYFKCHSKHIRLYIINCCFVIFSRYTRAANRAVTEAPETFATYPFITTYDTRIDPTAAAAAAAAYPYPAGERICLFVSGKTKDTCFGPVCISVCFNFDLVGDGLRAIEALVFGRISSKIFQKDLRVFLKMDVSPKLFLLSREASLRRDRGPQPGLSSLLRNLHCILHLVKSS